MASGEEGEPRGGSEIVTGAIAGGWTGEKLVLATTDGNPKREERHRHTSPVESSKQKSLSRRVVRIEREMQTEGGKRGSILKKRGS